MTPRSSGPGETFQKCDSGFVPDDRNGLCYVGFADPADFSDAAEIRCPDLEAELVRFEAVDQVLGLWTLLNNGET